MELPSGLDGLDPLYTKKQVAEWAACTQRNIDLQVFAGLFPAPLRLGAYPRWRQSALLSWLESQTSQGSPKKTNRQTAGQIVADIQRLWELATPLPDIAKTLRLPKRLVGHVLQHGELPEAGPQCDATSER